jgi:quercetin dioxygenase-like cupin family protein
MACKGTTIENPHSGERVLWHLTSEDTGGALVRAEWWVAPGGSMPTPHVHLISAERFEVIGGMLEVELDGRRSTARAGDAVVLPAGVPHRWWNAGDDEAHFMVEVEPPGRFEDFVETLFALARDGRVGRNGMPPLLQFAVLAHDYRDELAAAGPPQWVLRPVVAVLAALGRARGLEPRHVPA